MYRLTTKQLNSALTLFMASVVLLITAKIFHIIDIHWLTVTWDIDRIVALSLLLFVYFQKIERFKLPLLLHFLAGSIVVFAVAYLLGLSLILVFKLLLFTALVEEILFRGVLYQLLLKRYSAKTVLFGTSVIFALLHAQSYQQPIYGILVLLTGILLGATYLWFRERSIALAVVYASILHSFIILAGLHLGYIG